MAESVKLTEPLVNHQLVEQLTRLLEEAKTGELCGMVGLSIHTGSEPATGWSFLDYSEESTLRMIGGLEVLKVQLMDDGEMS